MDEIKQKFLDKEGSEIRYIRDHLKVFQKYEDLKTSAGGEEEDESHERSRRIIEIWKDSKKLRGYTILDDEGVVVKKKGHGKGKSKLFQFECIATPPSQVSSRGGRDASFSSGSTGSSGSSGSSSFGIPNSQSSFLSDSSSSSSSSFSHKRPLNMISSQGDVELLYDLADEDDEYAQPSHRGAKAQQLIQQGRVREASYEQQYKDKEADDEDKESEEEEEEEEGEVGHRRDREDEESQYQMQAYNSDNE
jgi:hypothetical protein